MKLLAVVIAAAVAAVILTKVMGHHSTCHPSSSIYGTPSCTTHTGLW